MSDALVVFERRLPGGVGWSLLALLCWISCFPLLPDLLDRGQARFEGTQFEGEAAATRIVVALGWLLLPLAWLRLWPRMGRRWGRCELLAGVATFRAPGLLQPHVAPIDALRVVDCTRWGVLVESELPIPPGGQRPMPLLLIPCAEAEHERVLALLGVGPRA